MKKLTVVFFLASLFCNFCSNAQSGKPTASLNHIALLVVDLQKAGDFYENILGLDTIPEPFHDGKHIWLRIGPLSHLHLISGADKPKEYFKGNHLCFTVASVDDFVNKLKARNMEWEDWPGKKYGITTRVDGVKQVYLKDPDGYWIEVNDAKE